MARALADRYGARAETDTEKALSADDVDAVIIGAPTNLHVELILAAARRGKATLCEKPIDLDMNRVDACLAELKKYRVPFAVGFNRRFDPTIRKLKAAVDGGAVGTSELLIITSRDPAPPPVEYVRSSGGYFRDSTIHDLDLARWLMQEEPVAVSAFGSNMVDSKIKEAGDFDTAATTLKTGSGKICIINNSRRSVYGFDQRVEVFGSAGMLQTENHRDSGLVQWTSTHTSSRDRLKHFFLERYAESFRIELDDFLDAIEKGTPTSVTGEDGRVALLLANAAQESATTGKIVRVTL
jgi:myo-inositol 2-dehydrogenase/D-chiro-inositol 1-dehydrogenase